MASSAVDCWGSTRATLFIRELPAEVLRKLGWTMAVSFPDFRPRPPWFGPDLQTLRNFLVIGGFGVDGSRQRRLYLPLADGSGDALSAVLNFPACNTDGPPEGKPLIVLIHGLSGCEESVYILLSTRHWLARGHTVLRINLRGAGPSRDHCRLQYHAGRSDDLRDALVALPRDLASAGLVLIGYSLGGNMLLKFAAEYGRDFELIAVASVSAPIDLAAASQRFLQARNRLYHQHLLRSMKRECFGGAADVSEAERDRVAASRSIYEFDELFVAPRNGYRGAEHYYAENNARRFLSDIRVPTLVIHSCNDPWIPSSAYTEYPWKQNPDLVPLLASGGGHVGFHERGSGAGTWYDRCIALFVDHLSGRSDVCV